MQQPIHFSEFFKQAKYNNKHTLVHYIDSLELEGDKLPLCKVAV